MDNLLRVKSVATKSILSMVLQHGHVKPVQGEVNAPLVHPPPWSYNFDLTNLSIVKTVATILSLGQNRHLF